MNRWIANRGLLQIFFALLLVIIIMIVSNYVVYKNSISGIYEKVTENNQLVMKNIIQSFDMSFRTVNDLIFNIHVLPQSDLKFSEDGVIDMAEVYQMQDNLASLVSPVDFVEDAIVFYESSDLAITSNGTSDFGLLFTKKYKHETYNAEYWRTYVKTKRSFSVFPSGDFNVSSEGSITKRKLIAIVGGSKVRLSDKNVIVLVDVDKLLKHVNRKAMIPGSSMILLDANRNVLLSTDTELDLMGVLNDVYFSNSREASLKRGDFEYNFYKSDYNGFIYIDKVPYQFQNIDSVTNASRMIMFSAIICAVILSVLLSIYLYRPVKDILKLLGGGSIKGNDFRKIYSGIKKVQAENESLKNQIEFVDTEIQRGVFLQTLDEHSHSREFEIQIQKYYPYFFQSRQFVMAAVHLKKMDDNEQTSALRIEEITELISAGLLKQGIDQAVVFHAGQLQFLALIGIDGSIDRKEIIDSLELFLVHAAKEELQSFSLWGCVSRKYVSKISNCHLAYQEINDGRIYRPVQSTRSVVDTESISFVSDIYLPFDKIEKLTNCLLSGNSEEGLRIVHEIMDENVDRNIHHYQFGHIAKTIVFHALTHMDVSIAERKALHQFEMDFTRRVDASYSYKDIRDLVTAAILHVGSKREHEPKSKMNPVFISQYIELHYMKNLYLDHMAEVLDTSPKYFSNYFKKVFGVNYVEYLNKVRLSHAKILLRDTDLSVADIGGKTGYMNSSTFTTTFKKYYGISPSEYRKQASE